MKKIDNIIQKTIDNFVNESIISEGTLDDIKNLLKAFKGKSNLSQDDLRKERNSKRKLKKLRKVLRSCVEPKVAVKSIMTITTMRENIES